MARPGEPHTSLTRPEENDETMSTEFQSQPGTAPQIIPHHDTFTHVLASYAQQMPSWHGPVREHHNICQCSYNKDQRDGSPHSLPSCLPSAVYQTISDGSLFYPSRPHSLPGSCNASLEHPQSLHSYAHRYPNPYLQPQHHAAPAHHCSPRPGHQTTGMAHYRLMDSHFSQLSNAFPKPKRDRPHVTHLSQEHRKVFVTYEADSEEHLKEIITFVALLRNNGFDTHIDVFEEQLSSISKIDCMERYLNEKDYLIIIVISLRYYKTISGTHAGGDDDEKTSNTVYIYRQLQSEFIQNGCRNYRFIPILFPGANMSHVPSWLRNTHIYSWPKDREDILRRLMRVEKYNPPPIGPLPTIVPIPL